MKNVCILFFLIVFNVGNAQIINFPDANFKNALVNTKCVDTNGDGTPDADADLNNDGEIDVSEAKIIDNLNVEQANIANLEGINHFISLTDLRCGFNRLESLNVQGLTNLKYIFCNVNILTSLNVQGLANLFQLDCSSNQLTTLNVEGLTNLKLLDCTTNQLKVLNVNGLSNLGYLYCNQNNLTSLNVEGVINMVDLRCQNNQLSSLIAKNLKNLLTIFCGENILKSLDIDGSKNLTFLSCKNNKFSSLDLHEFINLELLDCRSNQLKSLILKNTILEAQYLFFADNENLNYICCNENIVSEIKNLAIFNGPNKCEVNSYCTFTPGSKFYILKGKHTYKNILCT